MLRREDKCLACVLITASADEYVDLSSSGLKEAVMKLKPFALAASFNVVIGYLTMPPLAVLAATPQLAEKADDLVLKNVKIGKDGEVSAEVANTSKQTVGMLQNLIYSISLAKQAFRSSS